MQRKEKSLKCDSTCRRFQKLRGPSLTALLKIVAQDNERNTGERSGDTRH